MKLTGKQAKRIHDAILSGYTRPALVMALRFNMDVELDEIVPAGPFSEQVFALIQWAEKKDCVAELVQAVHEGNADNQVLTAMYAEAQAWFAEQPEPATQPRAEAMDAPGSPHQVFIAYSRHDSDLMRRIRSDLGAAGIAAWSDEEDLEPGTILWQNAIEAAIRVAQCMVVNMSPDARQSEWVNIELSRARRIGQRVFPVLARGDENDAVPLALETTQYVDVRSDYAGGVASKLIPALRRHLGRAEPMAKPQEERSTKPTPRQLIEFDWVTIPSGEFLMGSDKKKDKMADEDETPQHKVYLPAYRIARVPVTNEQYWQFLRATGYQQPSHWEDKGIPTGCERHPVVNITWHNALAFCKWAGVRLPTEAEWEKAARGTDGRIWPWGNEPPTADHCNFSDNVEDTTPVGRYPKGASPYGVLDTAGNVWEWTSTKFTRYPYDPGDGRENPEGDEIRTLRGGSWGYSVNLVRCAFRISGKPDGRYGYLSFRVVASGF